MEMDNLIDQRERNLSRRTAFLISGSAVSLCYAFFVLSGHIYDDADNYYIAVVEAGAFDDSNWCMYLNPLLCHLIRLLNRVYSGADWYTCIGQMTVFAGAWWLLYLLLRDGRLTFSEKIMAIAWIVFLLTRMALWNTNFTIQSAFFTFIGLLTLFGWPGQRIRGWTGVFFLCMGIAWRLESVLLFVPFAGLKLVAELFEHRKNDVWKREKLKRIAVYGIIPIMLIVVHYGVRALPANSYAVRYNNARSALQDYPKRQWGELPDQNLFSELEYEAAQKVYNMDYRNLDADKLETMVEFGNRAINRNERNFYLRFYLLELLNWRYGDTFYMILWLLLFFARAVCSENRKTCLTEAVLAVLGSCVIFIFFLEKGRMPLRILDNILFCLCFSLMRPLKSRLSQNWQKNSALCMTAALSIAIILTVKNCDFSSPQWALTANRGNTDIREELLIEGNEVFVWEDYSNVFTPYSLEGKIPPRAVARRHVPKGVWYHNQPYYMKMLASLKISNPAEALLEREETYYVSNDPSFLLSFLREHYGSNICCEQVGRILEIPYWRFQR